MRYLYWAPSSNTYVAWVVVDSIMVDSSVWYDNIEDLLKEDMRTNDKTQMHVDDIINPTMVLLGVIEGKDFTLDGGRTLFPEWFI